jgi:hypothetical protein
VALSRKGASALTAAVAVVASFALTGSALGADQREVRMQDDCDPATFNAVLGADACVKAGSTTFDDLIAQFTAKQSVDKWRFTRPEFNIDAGGTIRVLNEGGEAHTFTPVSFFGNGCSPLDNGEPVAGGIDCATFDPFHDASTVASDGTKLVDDLHPGIARFQCMIHPWMRSTVEVRAKGGRG